MIDIFHAYDATDFGFLKKAESLFVAYRHLQTYKPVIENDLLNSVAHSENQIAPIGLTIFGYALENAIKGELAFQFGGALDNSSNLQQALRGHELDVLHRRAFPLFQDEPTKQALAELSKFTIWLGRYSVPLKGADYEVLKFSDHFRKILEDRYAQIRMDLLKKIRPDFYR